eukprot:scaffold7906_cov118-Isochrysis_galbana.AAC.2
MQQHKKAIIQRSRVRTCAHDMGMGCMGACAGTQTHTFHNLATGPPAEVAGGDNDHRASHMLHIPPSF